MKLRSPPLPVPPSCPIYSAISLAPCMVGIRRIRAEYTYVVAGRRTKALMYT